ncbi:hypothetical protein [Parvularcula sp. IMCC14364]|uniref:hypothetical protein n=1 Tax=Parvularcula sp. IMCC14364 TaxID=3067902 RepID=UPI002741EC59|nr:hypothetical protein [Parvularcula sp. IMCC14364]
MFAAGSGQDTVSRFENDTDSLQLNSDLWNNTDLTIADVLATFGSVAGRDTILDFGDDVLVIQRLREIDLLIDDILIV